MLSTILFVQLTISLAKNAGIVQTCHAVPATAVAHPRVGVPIQGCLFRYQLQSGLFRTHLLQGQLMLSPQRRGLSQRPEEWKLYEKKMQKFTLAASRFDNGLSTFGI